MLRFQRVGPGISRLYCQKSALSAVAREGERERGREGEREKLALQAAAPQLSSYPGSITD
ncbi:hypothetical protein NUKP64_27760 [Klebsiella variicola]|nr:hypothetical protein NUKP64_27760 [Klebsiella variicola]